MAFFNQLITIPVTPDKLIRALEANYDIDAVLVTLQQNMFYMRTLGAFAYVYVVYPPAAGQTRLRLIVEQNEVLNEALRTQNYRDAISTIAPVRAYRGLANAQPAIDTASKQLASLQRSFSQPVAVRTVTATWPTIEATDADWLTAPVPPPTRIISNSPIYGDASFNTDNFTTLTANPAGRRTGTSLTRWLIGGLVTAIVIMIGLILVTIINRPGPITYNTFSHGNVSITYSNFWSVQDAAQLPQCFQMAGNHCYLLLSDGPLHTADTTLVYSDVGVPGQMQMKEADAYLWQTLSSNVRLTDSTPPDHIVLAGTTAMRRYFSYADAQNPFITYKAMLLTFFDTTPIYANYNTLDFVLIVSGSNQVFQGHQSEYDRIIAGIKVRN